MTDLSEEFLTFFKKIDLSRTKEDELRTSRDAIRTDIKNHFSNIIKDTTPKFYMQGSMAMRTTVNPLMAEYDIDDGVYLNNRNINFKDKNSWPTTTEAHSQIIAAVSKRGREINTKKDTCVRVIYTKNYHVDLPIYLKDFDDDSYIPKLAHKTLGWIDSDPRGNTNYYKSKKALYGDQLQRIIMYLKAMIDYQEINLNEKISISGFELTLLTCRDFEEIETTERDDEVLYNLISQFLRNCYSDIPLYKPITGEDLWNSKRIEEKDSILQTFEYAKHLLNESLNAEIKEQSQIYCRSLFGERFYPKKLMCIPFGQLTHRKPLPYKENISGSVDITATYSISSKIKNRNYNGSLLKKGTYVYLIANVKNIPPPYVIKWQVTNTGSEASNIGDIRGDFYDSDINQYTRKETTKYKGNHLVQAFVIKDDLCFAKSEEFIISVN